MPLHLRHLHPDDLPRLHRWLHAPHVREWWGGDEAAPTLAEVEAHYSPRILAEDGVQAWMAFETDAEGAEQPIGYAQSYVAKGSGDGWWPDETDPGMRGIDQFLADGHRLGQGLGTAMVRALVDRLFADPAVTQIQTDPHPDNRRAIRCYEKAGFVAMREILTPDGPALWMVQGRGAWRPAERG
jgi:aminoglycoside 6'-N-acetyltransferase-1b/aminoglycoside 6'-N-acetyltransferase-2